MAKNENVIKETVKFGEGSIEVSLSKKDLPKIKEFVKKRKYTNKTVFKLDCGLKNPVKMTLQVVNKSAPATSKKAEEVI